MHHVEMILFAAVVGFAGGLYWTARALAPPVQLVNGIYHNACCAAVELKAGILVADSARIGFKLENMKFGLTAYPVKPLELDGGLIAARRGAATSSISFNEIVSAFTLCGPPHCARTYKFSRF